jgi:hypothetical protein
VTEAAPALFVALESSGLGALIRQSRWLYMAANIGHIVALAMFAGAVTLIDVRLLGGLAATAPGRVIGGARKAAIAALLGLAFTGAILFTAEASHVVLNRAFQIKVALILLALLNIAWIELGVVPRLRDQPPLTAMPRSARIGAVLSALLWIGVAICGRAIAYV